MGFHGGSSLLRGFCLNDSLWPIAFSPAVAFSSLFLGAGRPSYRLANKMSVASGKEQELPIGFTLSTLNMPLLPTSCFFPFPFLCTFPLFFSPHPASAHAHRGFNKLLKISPQAGAFKTSKFATHEELYNYSFKHFIKTILTGLIWYCLFTIPQQRSCIV